MGRTNSILVLYIWTGVVSRGSAIPDSGRCCDGQFGRIGNLALSTHQVLSGRDARGIGGVPMSAALIVIPDPFDYSALDAETASNLRAQANRIRKRIGKATQDLIDIGRDLLAAKKHLLDHGEFIKWVESEIGIVRRTAQAYMAIAKLAEEKGAAVALLPPTTAHRLAAKSTPSEVVSEVVAKAQSGDVLPDCRVAEMISEAKSQKRGSEQPYNNGFHRAKQYQRYRELQEGRQEAEPARQHREKMTAEAAEMLFKSLGTDGVVLVIKAFAEEEWPWDLLSELRKGILLRKRTGDGDTAH